MGHNNPSGTENDCVSFFTYACMYLGDINCFLYFVVEIAAIMTFKEKTVFDYVFALL